MKKHVAGILFLCLVFVARNASATSMTFEGEGKVGIAEIHSPGLGDQWVYAGELDWIWTDTASAFYTYCVDVNNWVTGTENITVTPSSALSNPGVPDAGGKAAWLIDTYAPSIHTSGTGDDAAALQIAVWTALYDTGSLLNSGPFLLLSASSAITTEAQNYLTQLYSAPGGGYHTADAVWLNAPAGYGQDQMPPMPTPEPATLVLLGTGLAGVVAGARRRRKRASETDAACPTARAV